MKQPRKREQFECPNCGADVLVGAKACRECGSDASTGWQSGEEIDYQSLELPESDGDGGPGDRSSPVGARSRAWFWTALVLLVAIVGYAVVELLRMAAR